MKVIQDVCLKYACDCTVRTATKPPQPIDRARREPVCWRRWMAQCAELLDPLYQAMKKELLSSKVIGTDHTSVKVLDRKLPFARNGRIWPYVGDTHHPVIVTERCVVTVEVSSPGKKRPNRKIPDVCKHLGVNCQHLFQVYRSLGFSTAWKKT